MLAHRKDGIKPAIERPAISITKRRGRPAHGRTEQSREGSVDVDCRKVGAIGSDPRSARMTPCLCDRCPRQVVTILASDEVGPVRFEGCFARIVTQEEPVSPPTRHLGRGEKAGCRAPARYFLDTVPVARDDNQV